MSSQDALEDYCNQLRRRQLEGGLLCAKKTAEILRLLITTQRHVDATSLIDDVRAAGLKIQEAKPIELAVGNMVRRVLHIIREEATHEEAEDVMTSFIDKVEMVEAVRAQPAGLLSKALRNPASFSRLVCPRTLSLSNLLDVSIGDIDEMVGVSASQLILAAEASGISENDIDVMSSSGKRRGIKIPQWPRKQAVIDSLKELIEELDNIQNAITLQGVEHIHANEVILTFGMSDTTFKFLREVARKREFQVIVAEGAPHFNGHMMARKLADVGIQTTVIADAAVFAMMARANKVLVGAHAVLANGGVLAPVGIHTVALAAKKHSIPFVVLVGLHKLSPLFPHDHDLTYNEFKSPSDIIDYSVVSEAFAQHDAQVAAREEALSTPPSPARQQQHASESPGAAASSSAGGTNTGGTSSTAPRPGGGGLASFWSGGQHSVLRGSPPGSGPGRPPAIGSTGAAAGGTSSEHLGNCHGHNGTMCVPSPMFDYIPPHLVSLFVTDTGGYVPSYVYRLLTEYYSREDYSLSREPEPFTAAAPAKRKSTAGVVPGA